MAHELIQKRWYIPQHVLEMFTTTDRASGPSVLTATANDKKLIFAPTVPIDVYRFGVLVTTTLGGTAGRLDLYHYPNYDLSTGRLLIASATLGSLYAAGKMVYRDVLVAVAAAAGEDSLSGGVTSQTSTINVDPTGPLTVLPGQAVGIELGVVVAAAGQGHLFIEYAEKGFATQNSVAGSQGINVVKVTG